jgi:DNA-binding GntR family transcriptional regulator
MSELRAAFAADAAQDVRTLRDIVADQLRESVASGRLAPGQSLPESDLAAALNVSRGPVREALALLAHEGLVVTRRGHSAHVVRLSAEDAEEIYSLRAALETLAISRAAKHVTPAHIEAMRELLSRFAELTNESTPKLSAELDLAFHDVIYAASRHQRLQKAWAQIRPQVFMFLLTRNYLKRDFFKLAAREHAELLERIVAGDSDGGVALMRDHLLGAYERMTSSLALSSSPRESAPATEIPPPTAAVSLANARKKGHT